MQEYATKRHVLAELSAAAGSMSWETKEKIIPPHILRCSPISASAEEERERLKDIATALQISEIHFDALLEEPSRLQNEERS